MFNLPVSPEELIYDAVIARVTNDQSLSAVVNTWQSTPFQFVPTPINKLPMVRIEAGDGSIDSRTMSADESSLIIAFVLQINGGEHRDLMRLWNAVRRAVAVHSDAWMDVSLANTCVLYKSMMWRRPALTYRPNTDTKTLESTAILEIFYSYREACA